MSEVSQASCDVRPSGSLLPFGRSDRNTPIRSITDRRSLSPPSHTRTANSVPCGSPTQRVAIRAYHVPRPSHDWFRVYLSTGGPSSDVLPKPTRAAGPRTFWFVPISRFGTFIVTVFISSSLKLPMSASLATRFGTAPNLPSPLAVLRTHTGVTLSGELCTPPLPVTHIPLGYCWSHSRSATATGVVVG